jgi:hypothetical protein
MSMKIMPREQACDDGECPEFGTPCRGFLPCPELIEPQALTFHSVPPYGNDLPLWFSSYSNSTLPGFVRDSKQAQKESGNSDKNIRLSVSIVYETRRLRSKPPSTSVMAILQQPSEASCAKLNIFLPRIAASSTTMKAKRPILKQVQAVRCPAGGAGPGE